MEDLTESPSTPTQQQEEMRLYPKSGVEANYLLAATNNADDTRMPEHLQMECGFAGWQERQGSGQSRKSKMTAKKKGHVGGRKWTKKDKVGIE